MVYTGPSDGCHLCRKRRIKCDGGRPNCQRCIIYKAKCPGYRSESDYKFVNENGTTETKTLATRKRAASAKPNIAAAAAKSSPSSSSVTSSTSRSSKASQSPQWVARPRPHSDPNIISSTPAWEDWSVNSFIHDWTIPEASNGMAVGFLEFLPDLYMRSKPDLDFSLALKAASFASFANQHNSPEMMAKARASYGRALTALNSSLRNSEASLRDTTIASIVLLQIFEHITCDDSLSIGNHDAGLRMLFAMRGNKQLESAQGRSIARIVMGYLVCPPSRMFGGPDSPALQHGRDVDTTKESTDLMRRGCHYLGYPPEHPARQRNPEVRNMTDILAVLTPLFRESPSDPAVVANGIAQLQSTIDFDATYAQWQASLPPSWAKKELKVPFDPHRTTASTIPSTGIVHMYNTPLTACYINLYRIQYIVLHKVQIRVADHLGLTDWSIPPTESTPGQTLNVSRSLAIIRRLNDEVLASAACAMGEVNDDGSLAHMSPGRAVGAYYMLWPLTHVFQDVNSTEQQKLDANRALNFIGNVLGVKRGVRQIANRPASPREGPGALRLSPPRAVVESR
ncbi:fungal Zn(2)-Cys(6) binuclear cluster domain-containing protein 19 [Elsinoe australis]|uniref:Fungal Zn(2)-Cys(6) binuclear cluster domain-containing protein 19 n=1 Tax=Elsinoe australis TaxID=40998 RepID=A0A4U7ATP1_9PEZI|nr:fungal Zn(2)-Cys(6) binuclear cluster domain-containing protein 19 [Elsinoe australis]